MFMTRLDLMDGKAILTHSPLRLKEGPPLLPGRGNIQPVVKSKCERLLEVGHRNSTTDALEGAQFERLQGEINDTQLSDEAGPLLTRLREERVPLLGQCLESENVNSLEPFKSGNI
jgi:hypothetical protein